ncbi:hypothetical protein ACIQMV_12685 [Streptomyces sp. NPDC091412]|uniref:hypothetical protein n=1 Tax=Streptomyces sp. NPDC091412 TaxID=3366002 RepID=UPI0037F49C05
MTEKDRSTSLGPLELTDGRWVVGDPSGPKGYWVELRADGLYQHEPDSEGQLIPWPRVMLGMLFTLGAKYPARGNYSPMGMLGGLPGPWRGRGSGYLHMTLRHPYEDWVARFDRHPRFYGGTELVLFEELLRQTVQAGEAHLFGDPAWLGSVTGQLALQRPWSARAIREAVAEARQVRRRPRDEEGSPGSS